jgi:hypothetical protein
MTLSANLSKTFGTPRQSKCYRSQLLARSSGIRTTDEILQHEEQLANAKRTLDLDAIDRIYADDLLPAEHHAHHGSDH